MSNVPPPLRERKVDPGVASGLNAVLSEPVAPVIVEGFGRFRSAIGTTMVTPTATTQSVSAGGAVSPGTPPRSAREIRIVIARSGTASVAPSAPEEKVVDPQLQAEIEKAEVFALNILELVQKADIGPELTADLESTLSTFFAALPDLRARSYPRDAFETFVAAFEKWLEICSPLLRK